MKTLSVGLALLAMAATSVAHAAFIVDPNIVPANEIHATLDQVLKKNATTTDMGTILSFHDLVVTTNAPAAFINNSVFAVKGLLTTITLTPTNSRKYSDFSFVSQYLQNYADLTLTVQDSHGSKPQTFQIPTGLSSDNMHRFGIIAPHGDTIQSVTVYSPTGFHEILKNPFFSFTAGVPEPASWAMMLVGIGGIGAAMRSRRKMIAVTV